MDPNPIRQGPYKMRRLGRVEEAKGVHSQRERPSGDTASVAISKPTTEASEASSPEHPDLDLCLLEPRKQVYVA